MSAAEAAVDAGESAARLFTPLTAALMVLVGVFAFSALLVLAAYAPELRSGNDGGAHALSRSAVGFAGLSEALRLAGEPVVINRSPIRAGSHSGLLIVTPSPFTDLKAIEALSFDGPVLIVLPKWQTLPDRKRRGWVVKAGPIQPFELSRGSLMAEAEISHAKGVTRPVLRGVGAGAAAAAAPLDAGPVESLQTIGSRKWTPILADAAGRTVLAQIPDSRVFVLSDPDLLDTQGLKSLPTLATALALVNSLREDDGPIIFDVRLNGYGRERSPLRLLLDPPFLGVTLCLLAAAALAGFQAFCRFGPVDAAGRVIPLGKTALVDNTAALIRLAGREHRMGGRYAELTADLAARAVGAPRGLGGEALTAFLDRIGAARRQPETFSELAVQARMARDSQTLADVARRLRRWRVAMSRGDGISDA